MQTTTAIETTDGKDDAGIGGVTNTGAGELTRHLCQ
jgi:hypothetical protein